MNIIHHNIIENMYDNSIQKKKTFVYSPQVIDTMVIISDGNLEHVARAHMKKNRSFRIKENIKFVTVLNPNTLNRFSNRDCSLRAHLVLSYHIICTMLIIH